MKYTLKNKEIELTQEEVDEIVKQNSHPVEEKKVGLEIKNRFTGSVIFTSTKTTWKEAVEEAIKENADLSNADLSNADLRNADLSNAKLINADLSNADLSNTDLNGADLRCANLWNADLRCANLWNADLNGAELMRAKFYGKFGTQKLTKEQVPTFLKALGFIIED